VEFDDRDELMEDGLAAIKQAWTGEPVYASTRRWTAAGNTVLPPPMTQPHPPLWMGGNSRSAIERAITSCDGWAPFGVVSDGARQRSTASIADFDDLRKRIGIARDACERVNRVQPLDILVRPPRKWAEGPPFSSAREEIEELEEMGVSWISLRFNPSSKSDMLDLVAAWGEVVQN
jgi:alkanesulfonate monooxygenase SsuD/methylene tetrahydromethanopterin reductase-like flavin-dependent oxidoreductase (luciferase family)